MAVPLGQDTQHQQHCWLYVSCVRLRWSYYVLYQDFVVGGGIGGSEVSPPGPLLASLAHAVATWVAAAACCLCANACIPLSGA